VRLLRHETQDKGAQLRAAEDKLQEQRQAAAKVRHGQVVMVLPSFLRCSIMLAVWQSVFLLCRLRFSVCMHQVSVCMHQVSVCMHQEVAAVFACIL
jgi:hypothetical protein